MLAEQRNRQCIHVATVLIGTDESTHVGPAGALRTVKPSVCSAPEFGVLWTQMSSAASMSRRYWLDTLAISSPLGSNLKTSSESHPW